LNVVDGGWWRMEDGGGMMEDGGGMMDDGVGVGAGVGIEQVDG
jgi:hypothetical protein